jgi:anaerobic magnesium-protoporphyrin IX monomethyl ester cyclase
MKVYLLNPPFVPHFGRGARWQDTGRGGTLYYPILLSYAAAVVKEEHDIRLVDAIAWNWNNNDVINDVKKFKPDLLVVDSSFPSLTNDLRIAEIIKQNYDVRTVLVGPPCSEFPDAILKSGSIDILARFEYDFTIKDIANALEASKELEEVKGISFTKNRRIVHNPERPLTNSKELCTIPFVSKIYKKYLNVRDYFLGSSLYPEVQIFTGRGCPNFCTFCSWPQTLIGRKYRVRSIQNVLDELEWIENNLPEVKEVFFEDDTFTISRKRVLEFCKAYRDRRLNITWSCNARVDLTYEVIRAMKKANCRLLIAGYESGSNEVLQKIKKGATVEQAKRFAGDAKKAGMLVHGDFIIGLPGETKETIKLTKKLIKQTSPEILQVSVASPFPGTEFYKWAKNEGFLKTNDPNEYLDENGHQKSIVSYPWLSAEEITKSVDEILREYYISINYIPIALKQVFRKNCMAELMRLLSSIKAFASYTFQRQNKHR